MKDAFYFQHDYNARNDHKTSALISDHGATGYGVYWCLIEMLHEEADHALPLQEFFFRSTAKQTSTSVEQVLNIIKDCLNIYHLFSEKDGFFYSERVLRNINKREETREKRSIAGKISAEKRKFSTGVEQKATKKNKGKESKEKEDKSSAGSDEPKNEIPSEFIEAYKLYPSRKKRTVADEFEHLKKTCKNYKEILKSLPAAVEAFNKENEVEKTEFKYIKMMQGWISDKRWGAYIDEAGNLTAGIEPNKEPKQFLAGAIQKGPLAGMVM